MSVVSIDNRLRLCIYRALDAYGYDGRFICPLICRYLKAPILSYRPFLDSINILNLRGVYGTKILCPAQYLRKR